MGPEWVLRGDRHVRTAKCGAPSVEAVRRLRSAARQQWTTNWIELRLINRANPAIVAINDVSGSIVSGEK
jgi:hypothetical protein